jgi:hypothetical protein
MNLKIQQIFVTLPQGRMFVVPFTGRGIGCQHADNNDDPCK